MSIQLNSILSDTTEALFQKDWERQRRTANDILLRLQTQEGVILADQVGMGKTYVALAVAVTQILLTKDLGQVVIFVPAAVADKWIREWKKFRKTLLKSESEIRCIEKPARSGEEFLKYIDDKSENRAHIIVVTHTAFTATLKDSFIQLALLYYATRYLKDADSLRQRIAKWSTGMSGLIRDKQFTEDRVAKLLETTPSKWGTTWTKLTGEHLSENPIPTALESTVKQIDFLSLRQEIYSLPIRSSDKILEKLERARKELTIATQATWKLMLSSIDIDLPLLIVDEAHRLKNPATNISRLFAEKSNDVDKVNGAFADIFRRMLFLTATPFELGHSELIEVLSRMGAVRSLDLPHTIPLLERLKDLKNILTSAQSSSVAFDKAWGRLSEKDLINFEAWGPMVEPPNGLVFTVKESWELARKAVIARQKMNDSIRPWVIRHERSKHRDYYSGAAINTNEINSSRGIQIPESMSLPFLLAARAQSIELDNKTARPLFAYGIASSYNAYLRLGSDEIEDGLDSDLSEEDREGEQIRVNSHLKIDEVAWYRDEIKKALINPNVHETHPKVSATVEKAAQLWLNGDKCLIFCWFIRSGQTIEDVLKKRVERLILDRAGLALNSESDEKTDLELKRISDRLFRKDSTSYLIIRERLMKELIEASGHNTEILNLVVDNLIRNLQTPSYLVRFTSLKLDMTYEQVWAGINGNNPCRINLLDRWRLFIKRLVRSINQNLVTNQDYPVDSEIARINFELGGADSEDNEGIGRGGGLDPVRRAHGGTKREIRERLIAMFNTPLSPDLLVASSVMGEGIDLHAECRHIIHHDLDWNPSKLEQRTGRLDRIGSLAERENEHIQVYEPYLEGTHDEKMFRVVKDRSKWFEIVMGRHNGADELLTDKEEKRVPLHRNIIEAMKMDLRSPDINLNNSRIEGNEI
jgi:superfamily II DNA or RNA helicase